MTAYSLNHLSEMRNEAKWRALILFGRNVATYKFAFARTLLEQAAMGRERVSLEDIALPYAGHLIRHLTIQQKQITSSSSAFLDACRAYASGKTTDEDLQAVTVRLGFNNVVDAFQNLSGAMGQTPFYEKDYESGRRDLVLKDGLLSLTASNEKEGLPLEIEARWRLVETAWSLDVPVHTLEVHATTEGELVVEESEVRRRSIAPVRHALSGYQDGHCFYSALPIEHDGENVCHVDHLIPHKFQIEMTKLGLNLDGVWNLVLAEAGVNLSKSDHVPDLRFLEKLFARNEFYIASKHPLAETIVNQTGRTREHRRAFLNKVYRKAIELQGHRQTWIPSNAGSVHTLPWRLV